MVGGDLAARTVPLFHKVSENLRGQLGQSQSQETGVFLRTGTD